VPPKGVYPLWVGIALSIIVVLFLLIFLFFDVELQLMNTSKLLSSSRNVGYFDYRMKYFINIENIKNDVVYLKNKRVLGVLEVKPIEFSVMDKELQDLILKMYEKWLKNLTYPVQIVSRSTELDMSRWIDNIKESSSDNIRAKELSKFLQDTIAKQNVRNRVFYVIIPYEFSKKDETTSGKLKRFFGIKNKNIETDLRLEDFTSRINDNLRLLKNIGLDVRRLKTDELIGLYSSYFTDQTSSSESYITEYMTSEDIK